MEQDIRSNADEMMEKMAVTFYPDYTSAVNSYDAYCVEFEYFYITLDLANTSYSTRKRKSIEKVIAVLDERGIGHEWLRQDTIVIPLQVTTWKVTRVPGRGLYLSVDLPNSLAPDIEARHSSMAEDDIVDYMQHTDRVFARFLELMKGKAASDRKKEMVSTIALPLVREKVSSYMEDLNRKWELFIRRGRIVFRFNLYGKVWLKNVLTIEDCDRKMSIVPYLIVRPDRIKEDGLGFKQEIR